MTKVSEHFVLLSKCVIVTLTGITEYITLQPKCCIKHRCYKRVELQLKKLVMDHCIILITSFPTETGKET